MTSISGRKTWQDNNNAAGIRPSSITVRLLRDGQVIAETTATAAGGWSYSFGSLPTVDETGRAYSYTVSEQMVAGYYSVVNGFNLTNVIMPSTPNVVTTPNDPDAPNRTPTGGTIERRTTPNGDTVEIVTYGTPLGFAASGEPMVEELEGLIELFGYGTPLWGGLLQTGDQMPVYPFVFGGCGIVALLVLVILERRKRKHV